MRIKNLFNLMLKKIRPESEALFNEKQTHNKSDNKALFFTHVPKTGGTSFIVFLDRFFPSQNVHKPQLWWEVGDLNEVRNKKYGLFRGHLGGQSGTLLSDKEVDYITLVRDPVKLAYSTYQFVKRVKETALHDLVIKEGMTFETFLAHPKTQHLVTNRLIHNLCYGHGVDKNQIDFEVNDETFAEFRKLLNKGMQTITDDEKLQLASRFLDQCIWVGVLEDFDHAVRLLCYKMLWPPIGKSQKLNTHKKAPEISDKAYDLAQKLNKNDMVLYQIAKEKFEIELKQMYQNLNVNIEDEACVLDEAIDQFYQNNYLKIQNKKLMETVDFDCAQVLLGSQWHRREWSEIDQQYFRWSGPGNDASLDFWLKPNSYQGSIKIMDAINTQLLDSLKLSVNGEVIDFNWKGRGRTRTMNFKVDPKQISNQGLLRLTFHCQDLTPHHEAFGFEDERLVGIALSHVKIKAV